MFFLIKKLKVTAFPTRVLAHAHYYMTLKAYVITLKLRSIKIKIL